MGVEFPMQCEGKKLIFMEKWRSANRKLPKTNAYIAVILNEIETANRLKDMSKYHP